MQRFLPIGLLLALTLVLAAELLTMQGFAHGFLYLPITLIATWQLPRQQAIWINLTGLIFIWVGLALSPIHPEGLLHALVLGNRLMASFALVAICLFVFHLNSQQLLTERQNQLLERRSNELLTTTKLANLHYWYIELSTLKVQLDRATQLKLELPSDELSLKDFTKYFSGEVRLALEQILRDGSLQLAANTEINGALLGPNSHASQWVRILLVDQPEHAIIQAVMQDVTDLRRLHEDITAAREQFRQLADAMPIIVWSADDGGNVDYSNKLLADFTGELDPEIVNDWTKLLHPDDLPKTINAWASSVKSGDVYDVYFRIRRYDGHYHWFHVQANPQLDHQGNIRQWVGVAIAVEEDHSENK